MAKNRENPKNRLNKSFFFEERGRANLLFLSKSHAA